MKLIDSYKMAVTFLLLNMLANYWMQPVEAQQLTNSNRIKNHHLQNKNLIIVNSDRNIDRYFKIQEAYQEAMDKDIPVIYLNDNNNNIPKNTDFIFCIGSKAMNKTKNLNNSTVFFSSVLNWQRINFKNREFYGVSNELDPRMQLMMYKYFFPSIKKIGIIYTPKFNQEWVNQVKKVSQELDIRIVTKTLSGGALKRNLLEKLFKDTELFWVITDPAVMNPKSINLIFELAQKNNMPVIGNNSALTKLGAVLSISADQSTIGNQIAGITKKVLKNETINKNVQFPIGSFISLNLKAVKALNLDYNLSAMSAVNEVIE